MAIIMLLFCVVYSDPGRLQAHLLVVIIMLFICVVFPLSSWLTLNPKPFKHAKLADHTGDLNMLMRMHAKLVDHPVRCSCKYAFLQCDDLKMMSCALCTHSRAGFTHPCALCTLFHALCTHSCALCTHSRALCTHSCALCTHFHALCTHLLHTLHTLSRSLHTLSRTLHTL